MRNSKEIKMQITLIFSLHIEYMYQATTLSLINMYKDHESIKYFKKEYWERN